MTVGRIGNKKMDNDLTGIVRDNIGLVSVGAVILTWLETRSFGWSILSGFFPGPVAGGVLGRKFTDKSSVGTAIGAVAGVLALNALDKYGS